MYKKIWHQFLDNKKHCNCYALKCYENKFLWKNILSFLSILAMMLKFTQKGDQS